MGELLYSRGATPSALLSSSADRVLRPCPLLLRKPWLGASTVHDSSSLRRVRWSCFGKSASHIIRNPERQSRRCYGWINECRCQPLRDYGVPFSDKVCRKPAKKRVIVASIRSALVCDACEGRLYARLAIGSSSSWTGQQLKRKPASAFKEAVVVALILPATSRVARCSSRSQIHSAFSNNECFLGSGSRPVIMRSLPGGTDIPKRIKLCHTSYISHIEKRKMTVHCQPWWKKVLFQQLNEEDFGYDPEDEENGESSNLEEDGEFLEDIGLGPSFESEEEDDVDKLLSDDRRYSLWQQKQNVIDEWREFQETGLDPDSRDWEDWLDDSWGDYNQYLGRKDGGWYSAQAGWEKGGIPREPPKKPERGMNRTIKELLLRVFENQEEVEDDLNFEEKVFRFTSQSTAKFVIILILVPWLIDFLVHDFAIVPFLRRWVEEVPLAAKLLDLKESQKLHMIERLKMERQRVRFEAEIGKAPPLSDDELNEHIREEALALREVLRDENRQVFANIWSDAVAGFSVLMLLVFNPQQVAIMQLTGDRLFTNISDTGKAFIIILCTDIFLGYHSESGWETVIEILLDHYGMEVSQGSIYLFVAIVPVTIDACFKLWVFRYLSRLSPSAAATFREMKRH